MLKSKGSLLFFYCAIFVVVVVAISIIVIKTKRQSDFAGKAVKNPNKISEEEAKAKFALSKAYEEFMSLPAEKLYNISSLIELAWYLSLFDKDKAIKIIKLADEKLTQAYQAEKVSKPKKENGKHRRRGFWGEPNYTKLSRSYIMLALAARVDKKLAKELLTKAKSCNLHKSEADELLVKVAEVNLLVLDGNIKKAIEEALSFCQLCPSVVFAEGG